MCAFEISVEGMRLTDPNNPRFFSAMAALRIRVGKEIFSTEVMVPVTLVKLAESLYRDFFPDPDPMASHRLLCTDGIAWPISDRESEIWVHTSMVRAGDHDFGVEHLSESNVRVISLSGVSTIVSEAEYRSQVVDCIACCRTLFAELGFNPWPQNEAGVRAVWDCLDTLLEHGEPPALFQDWDFGWYGNGVVFPN